jgi:pre-rRNA-processing protein TSR4
MWTDKDDDFSSEGEAVRLYRPILYGKRPSTDDLTCSFIGGETAGVEPPTCSSCQESLPLLLQLFVPKFPAANQEPTDRTLQIFACNRAACVNALTNDSKFSYGGDGVVVCRRLTMAPTVPNDDAMMSKPSPAEAQKDSWVDGQGAGDDNDWAMDGETDSDMQDLESKLATMETMKVQPKKTKAPAPAPTKQSSKSSKEGSFPCFELSALKEPRSVRKEGLDDDDVGFSGSDAHIKGMLARYMAEEDDQFILAALKGSGGDGGGDGRGERDERLSPADRALLTYSDRLYRSPRQVARYALGGVPMWSM